MPWTFSTGDVDRYLERIDPEGWELEAFRRNPVVQWAHRSDIPAIGKADQVGVRDDALAGDVVFNPREFDPFGWSIGERVRFGSITAGSVGFLVLKIEVPKQNPDTELIYRRQELVEFSICNVPANPYALADTSQQGDDDAGVPLAASIHEFWKGAFV
jgi:HK97 family phage prohead protease